MLTTRFAVFLTSALLATGSAVAEDTPKKEGPKFDFHGFLGGSVYGQDAVFSDFGQKIFFVAKTPNTDKPSFGGDIRQSRANFSLAGPAGIFLGATPRGVLEIDFFGVSTSAAGQGAFGDINQLLRLRLAYVELNWGSTILRVGQDHDLVLGGPFLPATVGHIAQPLTYGGGSIGFRRPGITIFETLPATADMNVELALQIKQSDAALGSDPANAPNLSLGAASGLPGVEGRVRLKSKMIEAFVAGHFNRLDRNGVDNANPIPAGLGNTQDIVAGNAGVRATVGPFVVGGSGFVGKNVGPLIAFGGAQLTPANKGDVHEWGAWGQAGYNFTPELSVWGLIGTDHPNFQEVKDTFGAAGKLQNTVSSAMVRYMLAGVAFGLEYTHMRTKYVAPPAGSEIASPKGLLTGNQLMLSGLYLF